MKDSTSILFKLLRAALGNESVSELPSDIDWKEVIDLSFDQGGGVAAIAVDGLGFAHDNVNDNVIVNPNHNRVGELLLDSPELEDLKYEWFGEVFQTEEDYKEYLAKLQELMGLYRSEGIRAMVLKGYGLGLNYPIPAHRPTGDVDVYLINDDDNLNRLPAWKRGGG